MQTQPGFSCSSSAKKMSERVVVDCRVNVNQQHHVVVEKTDVLGWIKEEQSPYNGKSPFHTS